jgi:chemotaxis protein MotC
MRQLIAALCFLMTLASSQAEEAPSISSDLGTDSFHTSQLLQELDALFVLQDATAHGRLDAANYQKSLLLAIGERIGQNRLDKPDKWAPYVASYVLSGGNPTAASSLAKSGTLTTSHRQLLDGVSLFMRGKPDKATRFLKDVDVSELPMRVAGRVALAKAILEADPAIRQINLSVAAASMPGTLVEESALRRSAILYAEGLQEGELWKRLDRYQRRFPDSLYARTFWEVIASELSKWSKNGKIPDLFRLDLLLNKMPTARRRELYLHLARQSSRMNNVALVSHVAGRALRLSIEGGYEQQTARLYLSLHSLEPGVDKPVAEFPSIRRDLLSRNDKALLDARLWIAQQINQPLSAGQQVDSAEPAAKTFLETKAEELLVEVDRVLVESKS